MVATVGSIEVAFAADLRKYEAALIRGEKRTDDSAKKIGKSVQGIEARFDKLGSLVATFGKGLLAGAAGALTVQGLKNLANGAAQVTKAVADVGRQAKMAGVDVKAFSELSFVMDQARIPIEAFADGMKELNLRADEFVTTGGGSAMEAFGRLGYGAEDLRKKLEKPNELFIEIIGRLKEFDQASRIRISDELFGGSAGERFVELIDQGADGIQEQIRFAREMGLVMDREMIAKAEEADKKFNIIATTIGTRIKMSIVDAVSAWFEFFDSYREFEKQANRTLTNRAVEIDKERLRLENEILRIRGEQANITDNAKDLGFGVDSSAVKHELAGIQAEIDRLTAEGARIETVLETRRVDTPSGSGTKTYEPGDNSAEFQRAYREQLALTNRERQVATELERILADASSQGIRITREQAAALAEEKVARDERDAAARKGAAESDKAARRTETERQAVLRLIAEMEEELRLIGASDAAKRAANATRMAGANATDEERKRIIALNEAIHQGNVAAQMAEDQIMEARDITYGFFSDLKNGLMSGADAWEVLGNAAMNVLDRITDKLLNQVLDAIFQVGNAGSGIGGGGNFLGTLGTLNLKGN